MAKTSQLDRAIQKLEGNRDALIVKHQTELRVLDMAIEKLKGERVKKTKPGPTRTKPQPVAEGALHP